MRYGTRLWAALLIMILLFSMGMTAMATEGQELTPEEQAEEEEKQRVYSLPVQTAGLTGWPEGPSTYGEAAIVMEVGTGAILYAKNIDSSYYPASITKILTTLIALENGSLGDPVSFSADSVSFLEWGDAQIGMKEGNVITLEQALYAVLLASANEVSYAVAESVGENAGYGYNWFLEQMNVRCGQLGGINSHFSNPHGLHAEDHYTCAMDMALITREAFKHPEIFTIMQTLQYRIDASDTTEEHVFQQNHKMLFPENPNYYEYAIGGKTGFTDQALTTLVTMADNGEMQLVCVTLKTRGGGHAYPDTRALLDYAFGNFRKVDVAEAEKSEDVGEIIAQDGMGYVVLPQEVAFENVDMTVTPDEEVPGEATLFYTYEANPVGQARATLSEAYIEKHSAKIEKTQEKEEKDGEKGARKQDIVKWTLIAVLILLIAMFITVSARQAVVRKRRQRWRRR